MGKTSAKVKSNWNAKNYDCLGIRLPKGSVPEIKELAKGRGMSQAQLVRCAILSYCTEEERAKLKALVKEPENYKNGYVSAFLGGGGVSHPENDS